MKGINEPEERVTRDVWLGRRVAGRGLRAALKSRSVNIAMTMKNKIFPLQNEMSLLIA